MKVNVLSRLRNELNCNQKLQLYKAIIEPHFTYCASIIYISNNTDLHRLQVLQNKCMRQILRVNRFAHVDEMLSVLNLLNVRQIIILRTLIFIYKIVSGQAPKYLTDKIHYKHETQAMTLRSANELKLTNARKTCSQNALYYKGIKLFNSLPREIRDEESIFKFQRQLTKYVKEKF